MTLDYGYLVIACGSQTSKALPGVDMFAYDLDTEGLRGCQSLRTALRLIRSKASRLVVLGGGATGIEVAGELARLSASRVTMITNQCLDRVGTPAVVSAVRTQLGRLHVEMLEETEILRIDAGRILLSADRQLEFDLCVACTGLDIPPFPRHAGLQTNSQGRILVDPWLRSISDEQVFVAGDACLPTHETGAPPRMSAFFALTTGSYVARAILELNRGRLNLKGFTFATYGQALAIGRGGVGMATFPRDRQIGLIYRGRIAFHMRSFFVGLLFQLIRIQRCWPGLPFWFRAPGISAPRAPAPVATRESA
jgi:NADH dehydrogenase FAD-containing subunit